MKPFFWPTKSFARNLKLLPHVFIAQRRFCSSFFLSFAVRPLSPTNLRCLRSVLTVSELTSFIYLHSLSFSFSLSFLSSAGLTLLSRRVYLKEGVDGIDEKFSAH